MILLSYRYIHIDFDATYARKDRSIWSHGSINKADLSLTQ